MGDAGMASLSSNHTIQRDIHYSDHSSLNTLQVCLPKPETGHDRSKLWVVYIHGGAWRDPAIDAASFDKLQTLLLKDDRIAHVAGLASINYRLSPYASHETDPSNPADPARNAKHPDHINDILAAILYLQEQCSFEERYVLVGHSCGATLALQVAMKRFWGKQYESSFATELNVVPPLAIVGVEGIYDIPALLETYKDEPAYLHFIRGAFGSEHGLWQAVSPARADYRESWQDGRLLCLVHSKDDELVDVGQRDLLGATMKQQNWAADGKQRIVIEDLDGLKHDQVWEQPEKLADLIVRIISETAQLIATT